MAKQYKKPAFKCEGTLSSITMGYYNSGGSDTDFFAPVESPFGDHSHQIIDPENNQFEFGSPGVSGNF